MKHAATVLLVLALTAPAFAGMNPDCQVCIDFSGTATSWSDVQSRIDPELYTAFSGYFCIYGINGLTCICLKGSITPGISGPPGFVNLLPGGMSIGSWETGITLASSECLTDRFICVARLDLLYLGGSGDLLFLDHPEWPRWVCDCTQPTALVDYYCVWMHGGIGKDALEGDEECFPVVPVENTTWGAIKSLYR